MADEPKAVRLVREGMHSSETATVTAAALQLFEQQLDGSPFRRLPDC